jgi:hypothetical protein
MNTAVDYRSAAGLPCSTRPALLSLLLRGLAPALLSLFTTLASAGEDDGPANGMNCLIIYSQSIGRGVPPEARDALAKIVTLLEAEGLAPEQQVWGLEGERRVRVTLTCGQLDALLPQINAIGGNIELLKIEVQRDSGDACL